MTVSRQEIQDIMTAVLERAAHNERRLAAIEAEIRVVREDMANNREQARCWAEWVARRSESMQPRDGHSGRI